MFGIFLVRPVGQGRELRGSWQKSMLPADGSRTAEIRKRHSLTNNRTSRSRRSV